MKEENKDLLTFLLENILDLKIKEIKYLNLERNVLNIHVKRKHFDLFLDTDIWKIQFEINSYYNDYMKKQRNSFIISLSLGLVFVGGSLGYYYYNKAMIKKEEIDLSE